VSQPRWPVDPFEVSIRPRTPSQASDHPSLRDGLKGEAGVPAPGDPAGPGRDRSDLGTLARGGILGLVAGIGSSVFGFLLVVVVSRGLKPASRAGVLFEAIALFLILSNAAELGADTGLVRFVARNRALGRSDRIRRTVAVAIWPSLAVGVAFGAAVLAFAPELARLFIRHGSRADGTTYIRLFAPAIPLATATIVALSGTRGFGTMLPYTAVQGLGIPALRPVAMLAVLALGLGPVWIAMAYTVPVAIGFLAAFGTLAIMVTREDRKAGVRHRRGHRVEGLGREFWGFSAPRGLAALFQVAVFQLDILLVGALRGAREAGIYAAASRFIGVGTVALQGLSLAIAPQISAFLAQHERQRARRIYQAGTWWLIVVSWPVYAGMIVFAPVLMRVFGREFVAGTTPLMILSAAMLVLIATGNNKIVLLMGGGSGWNLLVTGSSLTINVLLNLVLIPRFGMNGAAVAYATSIIYDNLLTAFLVWRLLGLHPFARGWWVSVAGAGLVYGAVGLALRATRGPTIPALLAFAAVSTVLYVPFLWRARRVLHLSILRDALQGRGRPGVAPAKVGTP
jgi:O-antigen/teichoic acid export membrane protein